MGYVFNKEAQKSRRQCLRRNIPITETILWGKLRGKQINGLKFRRQYGIGPYIADFYCPSEKFVIEIDGDSHYGDKAKQYDADRTAYFGLLDIKTIRFTNKEITENIEGVVGEIVRRITPSSSPLRKGEELPPPSPP